MCQACEGLGGVPCRGAAGCQLKSWGLGSSPVPSPLFIQSLKGLTLHLLALLLPLTFPSRECWMGTQSALSVLMIILQRK